MLLENRAYSLAQKLGKSEDFGFIQMLKDDIIGAYASIVSSLPNNNLNALSSLYQTISEFDITESGNYIESIKIPSPVYFKASDNIILNAFNNIDNRLVNIDILPITDKEYIKYRKFTSKSPYLFYAGNGRLEAMNFKLSGLDGFNIKGIFSNPLEVVNYKKNSGCLIIDGCVVDGDVEIPDVFAEKIDIIILNKIKRALPENEVTLDEIRQ